MAIAMVASTKLFYDELEQYYYWDGWPFVANHLGT